MGLRMGRHPLPSGHSIYPLSPTPTVATQAPDLQDHNLQLWALPRHPGMAPGQLSSLHRSGLQGKGPGGSQSRNPDTGVGLRSERRHRGSLHLLTELRLLLALSCGLCPPEIFIPQPPTSHPILQVRKPRHSGLRTAAPNGKAGGPIFGPTSAPE